MIRTFWITGSIVLVIAAFFSGFQLGALPTTTVCLPGEACVREWLSATSGWVAALAALLTILYLSKQVSDADRHHQTEFAIQLRKHRILALRTAQIAHVALHEMNKQESLHPGSDIRSWDRETVDSMIHHLRETTISPFQHEIAHPAGLNAWSTSVAVERGYAGLEPSVQTAPELARQFFESLSQQAEDYLADVNQITGNRLQAK